MYVARSNENISANATRQATNTTITLDEGAGGDAIEPVGHRTRKRTDAGQQSRLEAEQLARLEAERQARLDAQHQARLEAERLARLEAERQARLEAERQARLDAQQQQQQQQHPSEAQQQPTEDARIRQIVHETMSGFRDEIADLIANRMQSVNLNQLPAFPDRVPNRTRRTDGNETEEDDRSRTSRHGRDNYRTRDFEHNSDRVLNIIRNWKIRFTGDTTEITVDDFIYRVGTLTNSNLRGDYDLLCEHAHLLFEGKALKWYWRFHKTTRFLDWDDLCDGLKRQFKDVETDFDIKDDILRRKQRPNETFDEFYDGMMTLCDRLKHPLTENDLCETIQRNLRPEVRHEILHLEINRISQLRKAVRRYEKFVKDMTPNKRTFHKQIFEIENDDNRQVDDEDETEVCFVGKTGKCWNCDSVGHSFVDCLEPRTVFCYGCGAKNIYKPNCLNCQTKRGNFKKDVRQTKDEHPKSF